MKNITLPDIPDFDAWRKAARAALACNIHPSEISWNGGDDLFATGTVDAAPVHDAHGPRMNVPADFIDQARLAVHHRDPVRYALLYRILWHVTHENRAVMQWVTDDDIIALGRMVKSVRRDAYKIKAFLRFREVKDRPGHFIAWYEPEHYTLGLSLPFFTTRFANMNWSILTPYMSAHWDADAQDLSLLPPQSRDTCPDDDAAEKHWLTYYSHIFNPARTKPRAMLAQMPKKYWRNMPETVLIEPMLRTAHARVKGMIEEKRER